MNVKESVSVNLNGDWMTLGFDAPQKILSWAILNGGLKESICIAWHGVGSAAKGEWSDPRLHIKEKFAKKGLENAVGFLTSADLECYVDVWRNYGRLNARCIATVGLSNALRIGDKPTLAEIGTINLAVCLSEGLSDEAYVEAVSLATEARTAAVLNAGYPSIQSSLPSTGTGTDCIAVAAPMEAQTHHYAGKHTEAGHLIGSVVYEAISKGVARFLDRSKKHTTRSVHVR